MKDKTYQVYCIVGGSFERVLLFEDSNFDKCAKVCESYQRNPRKAAGLARNYLSGWGSGIDDFFIVEKK